MAVPLLLAGCTARGVDPLPAPATTTWENIACTLPQLQQATQVTIASNTFHARRARRSLLAQAPELADRLHRACDYRVGEWPPLELLLIVDEVRRGYTDRHPT